MFLLPTYTSAALVDVDGENQANAALGENTLEGFKCSKDGFFSKELDEKVTDYKENDANMAESFMTGQMQNLWNIGDINGLSTLIFGNPYCVWADGAFKDETEIKMAPDGIFTVDEREKIINPILKMFSALFVTLLALAMLISGLKLGFSSVRGRGIAEFGEDVKMWIFALFFIAGYSTITNAIFQLNAAVVLSLKGLLESNGVDVNSFSIMSSWTDTITIMPIPSFLVVVLGEWILALILNFVYIARKVVILILLALGYVAAYSLLFNRSRAFFGTWMRELLGNVFLQSIHAIILYGMAMFASMGAGVIYKLGLMMMFIPLTGMISKWLKLGDSSSKMGSALTMVGLGGVMSTMMLTSQAGSIMRGGSMRNGDMSNSSNSTASMGGALNEGNSLSAAGGGSDSSITSISMDAMGMNSSAWTDTKNKLTNTAGAVFGAAGMVAGPGGSMIASKVGSAATGALLQAPRNVGFGMKHAISAISGAQNYVGADGSKGFKGMMGNLAERRAFFGNMGESVGAMVGKGQAGRHIGQSLSMVSRQRLASSNLPTSAMNLDGKMRAIPTANGGAVPVYTGNPTKLSGATLSRQSMGGTLKNDSLSKPNQLTSFESMAKQYPGADVRFAQTNMESSMWVKPQGANDWKQVGLSGAADPTLAKGAMRMTDYELSNPAQSYELQNNGVYKTKQISASTGHMENTIAGLSGSTPEVMRTSNAYVVGTGGNGRISMETMGQATSGSVQRYTDSGFKAENINPSSFVAHNIPNVDTRTQSDRNADRLLSTSNTIKQVVSSHTPSIKSQENVRSSWSSAFKKNTEERRKNII